MFIKLNVQLLEIKCLRLFTQQPAHFRDDRGRLDREIMVGYLAAKLRYPSASCVMFTS